jgi:hypothetical protein
MLSHRYYRSARFSVFLMISTYQEELRVFRTASHRLGYLWGYLRKMWPLLY